MEALIKNTVNQISNVKLKLYINCIYQKTHFNLESIFDDFQASKDVYPVFLSRLVNERLLIWRKISEFIDDNYVAKPEKFALPKHFAPCNFENFALISWHEPFFESMIGN